MTNRITARCVMDPRRGRLEQQFSLTLPYSIPRLNLRNVGDVAVTRTPALNNGDSFMSRTIGLRSSLVPSFALPMSWEATFLFVELLLILITGMAYWRIKKL